MPEVPSLGPRGEGWVVLQLVLIAVVVALCVLGPRWPDGLRELLTAIGALLALAGVGLVVAAARELGSGLTPFPRPRHDGRLVVDGPYRAVRHPIYTGGILVAAGLSLALSPLALVATVLLALLWSLKLAVEERFLREAHPEYRAYCERVPSRLVPFVY